MRLTDVSRDVMDDMMEPVTADHPAVGMVFAGICATKKTWAIPITTLLSELDVQLPGEGAARDPELGMVVEKVGRTSGYTSSRITETDDEVSVEFGEPGSSRILKFDGVFVIEDFSHPGDSGSVVCLGGAGDTHAGPCPGGLCRIVPALEDRYDLPLTDDTELAERVRDEFLSMTRLGRLITGVVYTNEEMFLQRIEEAELSGWEQAQAEALYENWIGFARRVIDNPHHPDAVVTQEMLDELTASINGLSIMHLTEQEASALQRINDEIVSGTLGMDHDALLAFMSAQDNYDTVRDILAEVPTIALGEAGLPGQGRR
ncbi:hypothetical protein [Haloechinothrix sp. LS1_15]|uniref:hypothetical protein n=1 Tax=Haloechinothrix sp. LS1_15 TaxID=2652248 RepID=UPI0029463170|nr:hypothetical protein [Haloechinothrix sp. LS1_15]MDV6013970.1 hypothetical protein [Haloechinothrix sp. LS1_15]